MQKVKAWGAQFCTDSTPGTYSGYTDGSTWNGWACPFFTREVAEKVLADSEKVGYKVSYDEERKAFVVRHEDDNPSDPEVFQAREIEVDGNLVTVYGIGAYSWVWSLVE